MNSQKDYKVGWHDETPIERGKTTVIRKELVGSTNPYGGGDTQCVGATYRQKGINIPDIMPDSHTHLRAHQTKAHIAYRLLLHI